MTKASEKKANSCELKQIPMHSPATPSADLYALGVTLFLAVQGHLPPAQGPQGRSSLTASRRAGPLAGLLDPLMAAAPAQRPTRGVIRAALREIAER